MSTFIQRIEDKIREKAFMDSYVSMFSTKEVIIENVKNVFEANEIMTRVKAGRNSITVWGENLRISSYNSNTVMICGKISSVEVENI